MSSTRNAAVGRLAVVFVAAPLLCGCLKPSEPAGPVARHPVLIDEAMERRRWAMVPAHYQNGETPAWPTGFTLAHRPDAPKWAAVFTDTPLFLANIIAMPVGYAVTPGWTRVTYNTGVVEPTYHAMPPLPPPGK